MTLASPPGGGSSPEREGFSPTEGGGQELKILHRRIFLSASNFMNGIGSYSLFDSIASNDLGSGILRRALEVTVLDKDMVILERPGQFQTYQELIMRNRAKEAIENYINAFSKDENFIYGFRLVKEFIREIRTYLDGSGADAKLNYSNTVKIGSTGIEMPAIEIKKHIMVDSRGYTLVEFAEDTFLKSHQKEVEAEDRIREGIKFAKTLYKIALVEETQKGKNSPTLRKLAQLHPR